MSLALALCVAGCGRDAGADELALDTSFLRDTAAGEVVLDEKGRPMSIYENDSDSLPSLAKTDAPAPVRATPERAARGDDDDDSDDRPRKKKKKKRKSRD